MINRLMYDSFQKVIRETQHPRKLNPTTVLWAIWPSLGQNLGQSNRMQVILMNLVNLPVAQR